MGKGKIILLSDHKDGKQRMVFLDNEDDFENADNHDQGEYYDEDRSLEPAIISVSEHSSDIDHDDDFLSQEDDSFFNDDDFSTLELYCYCY